MAATPENAADRPEEVQVLEFSLGDETYARNLEYIVFDPDQLSEGEAIGWTVDEVHQVVTATTDDVDEAPGTDMDAIRGVLKRDGEFVIWVDPEGIEA